MTISSTTPDQPDERGERVFTPAESEVVFQSPFTGPSAPRRRLGGISAVSLLLALAGAIAIAGVAFAVGRTTAGNAGTTLSGSSGTGVNNGAAPNLAFPGGRDDSGGGDDANRINGSRSVTGTVTSVSGNTITLHLPDGQSVQVSVDGSTTYHSQVSASQNDVSTGSQVIVSITGFGAPGSTSGITASDVTIAGN